jgi:hypothetical protein
MESETIIDFLTKGLPIVGVLFGVIFAVGASIYSWLKGPPVPPNLHPEAGAIPDAVPRPQELSQQQYILLREYHAQGLAQSKISFWFSLIFASLGFSVIMLGVGLFLSQDASQMSIAAAQKPAFTLISGTVIDAVAALFFVQSNRARQLMSEFFDKLRVDRKLDECLKLAGDITDQRIQSSLKAVLALSFAEVVSSDQMLASILGSSSIASTLDVAGSARTDGVVPFDTPNAALASR